MNENQFASLLGHAALKVWPELPREAQERLFAAAVDERNYRQFPRGYSCMTAIRRFRIRQT